MQNAQLDSLTDQDTQTHTGREDLGRKKAPIEKEIKVLCIDFCFVFNVFIHLKHLLKPLPYQINYENPKGLQTYIYKPGI